MYVCINILCKEKENKPHHINVGNMQTGDSQTSFAKMNRTYGIHNGSIRTEEDSLVYLLIEGKIRKALSKDDEITII
jgi:hypothetical protein